jgi:hypothetical protein
VDDLADLCTLGPISFDVEAFQGITDPELLRLLHATFTPHA